MFWGYSKWHQIKQSAPGLYRGLSSNFQCLRSVKFMEECIISTKKCGWVKKSLQMDLTWVCHYNPESKRLSIEWKYTNSPVKKKFWAQLSEKNIISIIFWNMKKLITIDCLEKGATVKGAFFLPIPLAKFTLENF